MGNDSVLLFIHISLSKAFLAKNVEPCYLKLKVFLWGFVVCVLVSNVLANSNNNDDAIDRVLKIEATLDVILEQNARLEQRVTLRQCSS